jgi:hypothetical protein
MLMGCETVHGSGRSAKESRLVPEFTAIEVSAGLRAHLATGPQEVALSGDDNILPYVSTTVAGRVLNIEPTVDFDPVVPLEIRVSCPTPTGAKLRAGGDLRVDDVSVPELAVEIEAGGDLAASGTVDRLIATLSAGGSLDTTAMLAKSVVAHGRAGGDLRVTASDEITGSMESGAEIVVFGHPSKRNVTTDESGGSVTYVE